ncbi:GntR family transcriptional regulator [Roseovarius pelagicus]|uniref:GntR family transcriptional regulator n=1 Tax=Roseovarius pelagicus TaxID=2980108 RepID=A0ABY6DDG7_9RHOB|nr:GntR family transcriptional regulator [Roseovarius pelagicus]UXX83889.1 GntR family transcriptional regulator [Roseovarius pelagicus]
MAQRIKSGILKGEYAPGASLPEVPVSRQLGVSRSNVREALRSLVDTGLVEWHPRRGVSVAELTPRRIHEIFTMRSVLEPYAVRLAIMSGQIRGEWAQKIQCAYDAMVSASNEGDQISMVEADMRFHWSICSPCDHEILLGTIKDLQTKTRLCIFYTKVFKSDVECEAQTHLPILKAVLSGEVNAAERALRDHIIHADGRLMVNMLDQAQNPKRNR